MWVEPSTLVNNDVIDKNSIHVIETFDTPVYHKLAGKTRWVES